MDELQIKYRCRHNLVYGEDGHYYIDLRVIYSADLNLNERIRFLVDTGAYLTVINISTANELGHAVWKTLNASIPLSGFTGSTTASLKELPKLVIGDRSAIGVKVAIPHELTKHNILGLNVLEHFKFFVDTENMYVYFADNPVYKLPEDLKCTEILYISDDVGFMQYS